MSGGDCQSGAAAYAYGFGAERAQEPFIHLFEMAIHLREAGAELNHEVSEWLKKS